MSSNSEFPTQILFLSPCFYREEGIVLPLTPDTEGPRKLELFLSEVAESLFFFFFFSRAFLFLYLSQTPNLSLTPHCPFGSRKFVFYVGEPISVL